MTSIVIKGLLPLFVVLACCAFSQAQWDTIIPRPAAVEVGEAKPLTLISIITAEDLAVRYEGDDPEVRAIAERLGLHNARKKDSTGICFIGERPFREFLNRYLPMKPGAIETPDGQRVGEHVGLSFYTLGQRKGIGIGGQRDADDRPWYVAGKDLARNVLIVVQGHDHPLLIAETMLADDMHWIAGSAPPPGASLTVRTRYRQQDVAVARWQVHDGRLELEFESPQWAVTPGQSAVLYQGEVCLGGAFIAQAQCVSA